MKKKRINKKLKKCARVVKIVGMAVVAAVSVYQLIPKNEKFEGIDGNILIENKSAIVD